MLFWESEPQYAYKRYACKKKHVGFLGHLGQPLVYFQNLKEPIYGVLYR